jgi:hypothetical protein
MRTDVLRRTGLIGPYIGSDVVLLGELSLHGQFWQIGSGVFYRRDHVESSSGRYYATGRTRTSVRELMAWFDTRNRQRVILRAWRHLWEYFRAVGRAPLDVRGRVRCFAHLLRRAVTSRERLAREVVDAALSGFTLRRLPQARS